MFSQQHRLGKTADVQKVFARGRAFFDTLLTVKFLARPAGLPRFTVVVSTKVAKSAVKRNRIKRLVREFLRRRLPEFKAGDYAVVIKPAAAKKPESELLKSLAAVYARQKAVR